jgi:hypothetical protein
MVQHLFAWAYERGEAGLRAEGPAFTWVRGGGAERAGAVREEPPGRSETCGGPRDGGSGRAAFPLLLPPSSPPLPGAFSWGPCGSQAVFSPLGAGQGSMLRSSTGRVWGELWLGVGEPRRRGERACAGWDARGAPAQTGSPCLGGCLSPEPCDCCGLPGPSAKPVCVSTFLFWSWTCLEIWPLAHLSSSH